jgi:hypothetical protein
LTGDFRCSERKQPMTVVAAIMTRHCTAHASDSLLTRVRSGNLEVVDDKARKLVRVPAWRGVIAYWGFARDETGWSTFKWLADESKRAAKHNSPQAFAQHLADQLTSELASHPFARAPDGGLGIHFTAYERVSGYWVPELFLVSNWVDASYTAVRSKGFSMTRETYATLRGLQDRSPEHGEERQRLEVHAALHQQPLLLRYVNGDPVLFNPIANAVLECFTAMRSRGELNNAESVQTHLALVRRPVELVGRLVSDFAAPGQRRVGGRPHDLAVSPGGVSESTTGDSARGPPAGTST